MSDYFEHMTWAMLRKQIEAGRIEVRGCVFCKEGTFCGRCAAPMRIVDSTCRACRGYFRVEAVSR